MLASYYKYLRRSGVGKVGHVDDLGKTQNNMSFSDFLAGVSGGETKRFVVTRSSSFILNPRRKIGIDLLFSFGAASTTLLNTYRLKLGKILKSL